MHAVYLALVPVGRGLAAIGVSANAISVSALVIAFIAAVAFSGGHFGVGAFLATLAAVADGLDGLVARLSGTKSRFGQVLVTTNDRYVVACFRVGIAVYVLHEATLLAITIAAITGSFMVSYASSVERELDVAAGPGTMRRAHRLTYLVGAAVVAPLAGALA